MMFSSGIQLCDFVTCLFLDHRLWRSYPPCILMHIRAPITAKQLIHRATCLSNSIPHSYNNRSFDQSSTVRRCSSHFDFHLLFLSPLCFSLKLISIQVSSFRVSRCRSKTSLFLFRHWWNCDVEYVRMPPHLQFNNEISIENENDTSLRLTFAL